MVSALSNRWGIGPFGTCSLSAALSYTDTSSLPLGFEQAAIFCIPNRRIEHGVSKHGVVESQNTQ